MAPLGIQNPKDFDDNHRLHIIKGISFYYTPEMWGGGKYKARDVLKEAVELFAREEADPIMPDWGHSEAYGWLGQVELDLRDKQSAKTLFEKALEIDPNNGWVSYLPNLIEHPNAFVEVTAASLPASISSRAFMRYVFFTFFGFRALSSMAPR